MATNEQALNNYEAALNEAELPISDRLNKMELQMLADKDQMSAAITEKYSLAQH